MRVKNSVKKTMVRWVAPIVGICLTPLSAYASTADAYPWTAVLKHISSSLKGPVGYFLIVICIVMAGAIIMFTDLSSGGKHLIKGLLGASVIVGVLTIVNQFFPGISGALIL